MQSTKFFGANKNISIMTKPSTQIIQQDQIKILLKDFSESEIAICEDDISGLINEKSILLVETESLDVELPQINYDNTFKCCLIETPENISLLEIHNVVELIPTESTVYGLRCAEKLKIKYLINQL